MGAGDARRVAARYKTQGSVVVHDTCEDPQVKLVGDLYAFGIRSIIKSILVPGYTIGYRMHVLENPLIFQEIRDFTSQHL